MVCTHRTDSQTQHVSCVPLKTLQLCTCPRVPKLHNAHRIPGHDGAISARDPVNHPSARKQLSLTYPNTPTAQTRVRSPRILSVPIRSSERPVEKSHFLRLLSEQPVTSQESVHSSSSSSESDSSPAACVFVCRGTGGPHAMLSIRLLTLSRRRRWLSSSYWSETSRTEPSSQPSARRVEAGLGEMDHMGPPCELSVR